jgi:SAM-dependent methyltransferase
VRCGMTRPPASVLLPATSYGRPGYSPELEVFLAQEAGLCGNGRLLDVGCCPGVLTVRLAHLFVQAVGLGPDAGMLAEGRRAAGGRRVMNIWWVQGLAEDLPRSRQGRASWCPSASPVRHIGQVSSAGSLWNLAARSRYG